MDEVYRSPYAVGCKDQVLTMFFGDFNFVEDPADRLWRCGNTVPNDPDTFLQKAPNGKDEVDVFDAAILGKGK